MCALTPPTPIPAHDVRPGDMLDLRGSFFRVTHITVHDVDTVSFAGHWTNCDHTINEHRRFTYVRDHMIPVHRFNPTA